ncbi:MAG TPA: YebC/PmpR family DNA-binding transcriptional regulator, partial [Stellaceae bacterium]|nr:YebC/PmpR family DNA-binding transcriptional regulator [Stellaceae bacterium]
IVEALTDNRNRTASEVRAAFTKAGGALGETNSVGFLFDHVGEIVYPAEAASADAMLEAAIEAGAEDVESDADGHVVIAAPEDFNSVRDALEARFGPANSAKLAWRPKTATIIDEETAAGLFKLLETLEDSDDVQNVYANFEIGEEVLARLSA